MPPSRNARKEPEFSPRKATAPRSDILIREAKPDHADEAWRIFEAVVRAGDAFPLDPETTREQGMGNWLRSGRGYFVAELEGRLAGAYILMPNQPGLGSHVANASFAVAPECRRLGVGRAMGEHALAEARRQGYRAMQFNLVVSTNEAAVTLWRDLGFEIVGRLPGSFHLKRERYVDAYVMYRSLEEGGGSRSSEGTR